MLPTADKRWSALFGITSYEEYFERIAERIYLKSAVDENVQGVFKLVQRLVDLAYYEFEFMDLACMKALFAFELALKRRFQDVKDTTASKPKRLKDLIEWFRVNGYFETDSAVFFDQLRYIRNHFAHPEIHSFGGPLVSWQVAAAAGLINDLYEDVNLRKERKKEILRLNSLLDEIIESGAVLEMKDGRRYLVHIFRAGFFNNKVSNKIYHFGYKPAFEIPKQYTKGDSVPVYPAYELTCNSLRLDTNELIGLDGNGEQEFRIFASAHESRAWYEQYKAYVSTFPHFRIVDNRAILEIMSKCLYNFHRI